MKGILKAGSLSGLVIVIGEGVLNGALLSSQWSQVNSALGLATPSNVVMGLAMVKLFILGFFIIWLYDALSHKYGHGVKTALLAGLVTGGIIWGWALFGLWLAGYINNTIALYTFFWGMIELPLASLAGFKLLNLNDNALKKES